MFRFTLRRLLFGILFLSLFFLFSANGGSIEFKYQGQEESWYSPKGSKGVNGMQWHNIGPSAFINFRLFDRKSLYEASSYNLFAFGFQPRFGQPPHFFLGAFDKTIAGPYGDRNAVLGGDTAFGRGEWLGNWVWETREEN